MLIINSEIDLHYSPDDAERTGKGYYLQRHPTGETSQLFKDQFAAKRALETKKALWS